MAHGKEYSYRRMLLENKQELNEDTTFKVGNNIFQITILH